MKKFLDLAGLAYLWSKIKSWVLSLIGNGTFTIKANSAQVKSFTANLATNDSVAVNFKDGIDISLAGVASTGEITINHGNTGTGTALTTPVFKKFSYNALGHINGVADVTNEDLPVPVNDAKFLIKTKSGETVTEVADFTANQQKVLNELDTEIPDDITFVLGANIVLTPDSTNRKITIAAVATAPNDKTLTVNGDTGSQVAFSADSSADKTLTIEGGRDVGTAVTSVTGGVKVVVDHDVMNSSVGNITLASSSSNTSTYLAGGELLSGIELTHTNGHITGITSTYKRIGKATLLYDGLMSAADKIALDNINTTISTALTSAITPSGSVTAQLFADLVNALNTILSSTGLGNLYTLTTPLVIGPTQTGDVSLLYGKFVEGYSVTNNGTVRYEIPAGTNLLIVNTGTPLNPVYQVDMVGTYDNSYWNHNELKPIPVDTSDEDYEAGDDTIDSICV